MSPEESWVEAFDSSSPEQARGHPQLTRAERSVAWGCWFFVACLLLFLPVASVAGLGAVWLVLLPFYALPVLLGLTVWAAWRRRGRLPAAVWIAVVAFITVGIGFSLLISES